MINFLLRLFDKKESRCCSEIQQDVELMVKQKQQANIKSPLDKLWDEVGHLSHSEYKFLLPGYSPNSRVPCADFTPFLVERLRKKDVASVYILMRKIVENNAFGMSPAWIDAEIDDILGMSINKYLHTIDDDFQYELISLFILGMKCGGSREFLIIDEKCLFFAYALCCHKIILNDDLSDLRSDANRIIKKHRRKKKGDSYSAWDDHKLFMSDPVLTYPSLSSDIKNILLGLPLLARLHIVYFSEKSVASLMQSTVYGLRSLGLNPIETSPKILESGVCEIVIDAESLGVVLTKNDTISILDEKGIEYKKSWNKQKLLEILISKAFETAKQIAEREKIVRIKPEFIDDFRLLREYVDSLRSFIELLAGSPSNG